MFVLLKRAITTGAKIFSRQKDLVSICCFVTVLTISLATALFLFHGLSDFLVAGLQDRVDISVYFKEETDEGQILTLKEELSKFSSEIKNVEYISREEALLRFVEEHKEEEEYMESLASIGENPFLASLNVQAWQASQYASVANFLENGSFKDLIHHCDYSQRKEIIDRLFAITGIGGKAGIMVSVILGLIAFVIAFNTIRIAIYTSKEEISVMRLVGASNWFIRGPFIIQGIFCAFIAVSLSLLIFGASLYFFGKEIQNALGGFDVFSYFLANIKTIVLGQIAIAMALSIIPSFAATRKYLKI